MRVLMVGTCRIYRSAMRIRAPGVEIVRAPHRFHTPGQVREAIRYFDGADTYPHALLHTLSRRAIQVLTENAEPFSVLDSLRAEVPAPANFDAFILEISASREHFAQAEGHGEVLVNSLVAHDVGRLADELAPLHASGALARLSDFRSAELTADEIVEQMRVIKEDLGGKPIVWVSHCNIVSASPSEASVMRRRGWLSQTIAEGAAALGDHFHDPTEMVAAYGRSRIFENGGRDLNHFTDLGHRKLAERLTEILAPGGDPEAFVSEAPDDTGAEDYEHDWEDAASTKSPKASAPISAWGARLRGLFQRG